MKSLIKDWYTGKNIPVEMRLPQTPAQRALARDVRARERRLCALLDSGLRAQYEALADRRASAEQNREAAVFARGVGLGMRLALEAMEYTRGD